MLEAIKARPILSLPEICRRTGLSFPGASSAMDLLVALEIAHELTGRRCNRLFVYDRYLAILSEGTEGDSLRLAAIRSRPPRPIGRLASARESTATWMYEEAILRSRTARAGFIPQEDTMSGVATAVERIREMLFTLSEQERRRALAELSLLPCTVRFEDVVISDEDDISWVDDAEYDGLSDAETAAQMNEIGGWIDANVAVPTGATLRLYLDWRLDFSCNRLSIETAFDDEKDRERFTPEEVEILEAELIPMARPLIENLLQRERLAEPFDVLRRVRRLAREGDTESTAPTPAGGAFIGGVFEPFPDL